jgi:hypothetical protein
MWFAVTEMRMMKLGAATDASRGIGIGLLMAYAGEEKTKIIHLERN